MENAVALVNAYLHVNGYFTVAEYPVLEALRHGGYQTATDVDILAFRFPQAVLMASKGKRGRGGGKPRDFSAPDTALGIPADQPDMIIGEVKEGRARLNPAVRDAGVLAAVLGRFGCCQPEHIPQIVEDLLRAGRADSRCGHRIRMMAFGVSVDETGARSEKHFETISMGHVVRFLQSYLDLYWDVLSGTQFKDEAFGFLLTLKKALRG